MCAQYQINREPVLLNQSNGQMRNNEGTKNTFNCWGCSEQPGIKVESAKMVKYKGLFSERSKVALLRLMFLTLFLVFAAGAWAQGPYPNQGPHTVCLGQVAPYGVINTSGSTYAWSIIPLTGGNGNNTRQFQSDFCNLDQCRNLQFTGY